MAQRDVSTAADTAQRISESFEFKVPFFDVDSMDIVWHGHYCKYMELARCELLDKIGYNYLAMKASGFGFPIVDLQIKYIKPLLFEQRVRVEATLAEWQYRLKINYVFYDVASGDKLTKAHTIQAAVDQSTGLLRLESPPQLLKKVQNLLQCPPSN